MTKTSPDLSLESLLAEVIDEFTERLNSGQRPDVEEYAARWPQAAGRVRQVLQSLLLIRSPLPDALMADGTTAGAGQSSGQLGDFRFLREIGRGGMGVVYEAEQISLRRRVALKILPFAAVLDPRHLQRFKNEALAAASLDHPNIVHVHAVGCERGVHYYAMSTSKARPSLR